MLPGLPGWAQNHPNQLAQLHQKTRMMSQLAHNIEKARMGFHGEVKRDAMAREHQESYGGASAGATGASSQAGQSSGPNNAAI